MGKTPKSMVRGRPDPVLGAVLRQAREDAGYSQVKLAGTANLSLGTITRLESGESDPSWSSIVELLRALGLSFGDLAARLDAEDR